MIRFNCPAEEEFCPYWKEDSTCSLFDEGYDPIQECEKAFLFVVKNLDYWDNEEKVTENEDFFFITGYNPWEENENIKKF